MTLIIHRTAALIASLCITVFLLSSLFAETFGTYSLILEIKGLIVFPGLLILIPSIAVAGASGFSIAKLRKGKITRKKKQRMPIIGANGVLILIPCAFILNHMASIGAIDGSFYKVQAIEFIAGVTNLILMLLNIRDGLRLSGRLQSAT